MWPEPEKAGRSFREIEFATATIDASGKFVIRTDPTSRPLIRAIAEAIRTNSGWLNVRLNEYGSDRKSALTGFPRQYVDASGKPFTLSELQAAPESGHWIGDDTSGPTSESEVRGRPALDALDRRDPTPLRAGCD